MFQEAAATFFAISSRVTVLTTFCHKFILFLSPFRTLPVLIVVMRIVSVSTTMWALGAPMVKTLFL